MRPILENVKKKLVDLKPYLEFPQKADKALDAILKTQRTFVLCEQKQSSELIYQLALEAERQTLPFCVIHALVPSDIDRLLTQGNFDEKTQEFKVKQGPLAACLNKGGFLILLDPLSATAENFNGILDGQPFERSDGQLQVISKNLKVFAIHSDSRSEFKITAISPAWRDRFEQIRWLPQDLSFETLSSTDSRHSEKNETKIEAEIVVIDCKFYPIHHLTAHLFHSYPKDESGKRAINKGELARALERKKPLRIILNNLDTSDPGVRIFIEELLFTQRLKKNYTVDGIDYSIEKIEFCITPEPVLNIPNDSRKIVKKISADDLDRLQKKISLWWLNQHSIGELDELVLSRKNSRDEKYSWDTTKGLLEHFKKSGDSRAFIIYQPLLRWHWYKLIQDPQIKSLYVCENVLVEELWEPLFNKDIEEKFSDKPMPISSTRTRVCLADESAQSTIVHNLLQDAKESKKSTLVLDTSSDYDEKVISNYDSGRRFIEGGLLTALKKTDEIIITGKHLINKIPNFFNLKPFITVNGEVVSPADFKAQITLVIDGQTLMANPFLKFLPAHIPLSDEPFDNDTILENNLLGLKTALDHGHNLILAIGEKASGKSYSLKVLTQAKIAKVFTYTLSPTTTFSELEPIVMEWAEANETGDTTKRILAFDELNLADPEVLLWLLSLKHLRQMPEPKLILPNGKILPLNPDIHCFIGLMNDAQKTVGRNQHLLLEKAAAIVHYRALSETHLTHILTSAIVQEVKCDETSARSLAAFLMSLRAKIASLQPELYLDPRDFLAIISRLASETYQPGELKNFGITPGHITLNIRESIDNAIKEIIGPQLKPDFALAFSHWVRQRLGSSPTTFEPRSLTWAKSILSSHPELWQTRPALSLMASILGYLQTYAFYRDKHNRLLPGKSAFLILGETNSGKTFISQFILKEWGLTLGADWLVWNAGAHGDLLSLIKRAQKKGLVVKIEEVNLLPTALLEGALNAALCGDCAPGFALILTANPEYNYREVLSEPLLSRMKIAWVPNPTPEELMEFHKVKTETSEPLLAIHQLAGPLASTRGLLNAIHLCESKIEIHEACAMTYGLILQTICEQADTNEDDIRQSKPYSAMLTLVDETHLIVSTDTTLKLLGELDAIKGIITLPHTNSQQAKFDFLTFHALMYQNSQRLKINSSNPVEQQFTQRWLELQTLPSLKMYYPGALNTLITTASLNLKLKPFQEIINFADDKITQSDVFTSFSIGAIHSAEELAWDGLLWHVLTIVSEGKPPNWDKVKILLQAAPKYSPYFESLQTAVNWLDAALTEDLINPALNIDQSASLALREHFVKTFSTSTPDIPLSSSSGSSLSTSLTLSSSARPREQTTSSGGLFLEQKSPVIAKFTGDDNFFIPLHRLQVNDNGVPLLKEGEYQLENLPTYFFSESKASYPTKEIIVTLQPPLIPESEEIQLYTPIGYCPTNLPEDFKLTMSNKTFYATYTPGNSELLKNSLSYSLIPVATKNTECSLPDKKSMGKDAIDRSLLSLKLQQCLLQFQQATTIAKAKSAFTQLTQTLKSSLSYLDREDHRSRQNLLDTYGKEEKTALKALRHCLQTAEVVCIESAAILWTIAYPILQSMGLQADLVDGKYVENGIMTSEGHTCVTILWPGETLPEVYDPTPAEPASLTSTLALSSHSCFSNSELCSGPAIENKYFIPVNPLLEYFRDKIEAKLAPALFPFYKISLTPQHTLFKQQPPGELIVPLDLEGKPPFMQKLLDSNMQTQTLLFTEFPDLPRTNSYEQLSCVKFLINIFINKGFNILVWTRKGPISIKNENQFIEALMELHSPTKEKLKSFKSPHPFKIIDKRMISEFYTKAAKVLSHYQTAQERENYRMYMMTEEKVAAPEQKYAENQEQELLLSKELEKFNTDYKAVLQKEVRYDRDIFSERLYLSILLNDLRINNEICLALKSLPKINCTFEFIKCFFIEEFDFTGFLPIKLLRFNGNINLDKVNWRSLPAVKELIITDYKLHQDDEEYLINEKKDLEILSIDSNLYNDKPLRIRKDCHLKELRIFSNNLNPCNLIIENSEVTVDFINFNDSEHLHTVQVLASGLYHKKGDTFKNYLQDFCYKYLCRKLIFIMDIDDPDMEKLLESFIPEIEAAYLKNSRVMTVEVHSALTAVQVFQSQFLSTKTTELPHFISV